MLTARQKYRLGTALFLCALIFVAFFGAYSSRQQQDDSNNQHPDNGSPNVVGESPSEVRIADATSGLEWFTGVLAASTIGLWITSICGISRQSRDMRESLRRTDEQIELARQEFVSTHRPKMRVRRITATSIQPNLPVTAMIEGANIGATTATILQMGIDIFPRGGVFSALPKAYPHLANVVSPGSEIHMGCIGSRALTAAQISQITANTIELCLLGIINYEDGNKTVRSTSFFRVYDPGLGRFMHAPPNDPEADREYEN